MEFSDLNRRGFLKQSATAAAVGTGLSASSLSAAALSKAEVEHWQSQVGKRFRVGDADLLLHKVNVTDHSTDSARPRDIRSHAIAMLFVLQTGTVTANQSSLQHGNYELHVTQVIPPRGESGAYFEAILN